MKKAIMMAALATCMAVPAMAQDKPMTPPEPGHEKPMPPKDMKEKMDHKADMWFDKIDANKDGFISKEEHDDFSNKMFAETDANKDGKISKEEMKAKKMEEHKEMKGKM